MYVGLGQVIEDIPAALAAAAARKAAAPAVAAVAPPITVVQSPASSTSPAWTIPPATSPVAMSLIPGISNGLLALAALGLGAAFWTFGGQR